MRTLAVASAGRFAREALAAGPARVAAVFRHSFYVEAGGRHACIGGPDLGGGPLNARVAGFALPRPGEALAFALEGAGDWTPPRFRAFDAAMLREAKPPAEGLGCLAIGEANALARHARPALEALGRFLDGAPLGDEAAALIGLGPGLTPAGDDYLGGLLVALRASGRNDQAGHLWRWLAPRLARTSEISAAHLEAAAAGEAHEALHEVLNGDAAPARLDAVGHSSGWDAFAGAVAVLRRPG